MSASSVTAALAHARALGLDRLDAQLLLCQVLARDRSWLLAHGEQALDSGQQQRFDADCARRAAGEPLAYLVGEREFHGLRLHVDRAVLVPRPDTETLVDWALELLAEGQQHPAIADLGTGSGAIALAIAHSRPDARVCAVELSPTALDVASANGRRLGIEVEWLLGDWWQPLAGRRFEMVLSNPPYIAAADPHLGALCHEPQLALTAGGDGLSALRAVAAGAARHLIAGGWLLVEHGHEQGDMVSALLRDAGLVSVQTRTDLAGWPRCTAGRLGARL